MSFHVEKMIIHNRAPFKHLEIDFKDKGITLLTAINGGGKTTILSHLTDAWYEMVRNAFPNEFEGKEGKYYRLESPVYSLNFNEPSIVYIRFSSNAERIDYLDIRGECTSEKYASIIKLGDSIAFTDFDRKLANQGSIKHLGNTRAKVIEKIFSNNIITSFPAYRYERPGYLNDPFEINLKFNKEAHFNGYLDNPIEVISGLPELINWILDLMLDHNVPNSPTSTVLHNINEIFSKSLGTKFHRRVRLGIGPRYRNNMRIQVVSEDSDGQVIGIYPTIFDMSSGENAMVCLFGELVRQYDKISPDSPISQATGVVLIDEIDKHLHIRLQKEVLPELIKLFPNIQFIISSHSPFVTMGLAKELPDRTNIIDLDYGGISIKPEENSQYQEAYEMMIDENKRFYEEYQKLNSLKEATNKLIIISEGHNRDHIKKAIEIKAPELLNKIKFLDSLEDRTGETQLVRLYDYETIRNNTDKVLFVWDCDSRSKVDGTNDETDHTFKFCMPTNSDNTRITRGIENLYPENLFSDDVYDEKDSNDGYGGRVKKINKNRFFDEKIVSSTDVSIFDNFQPLIKKIQDILEKDN